MAPVFIFLRRFIGGLLIVTTCLDLQAAVCDTIDIASKRMDKSFRAIVIIPDSDQLHHWPVVYLLHGLNGSYRDWYKKTDLESLADHYQLIIVCPDGGYDGWYLDSPLNISSSYESYIAIDVINYIDQHYPTIDKMEMRALCGLSMGGHGAFSLLAKYPERFAAAGSMSGVMRLTSSSDRYGLTALLGPFSSDSLRWKAASCLDLAGRLSGKNKNLIIDCGIEDKFIEDNRLLHQKLIRLQIAHDYYERPGGHGWAYWTNALPYHLLFFKNLWQEKNLR